MGSIAGLFGYLLNALYEVFHNYGIAIIIFSIILRLILIPITIKQQKSMKKSAELQEEMKEIQRKYKNNPEKLNQETIDLYKREKMSPFSRMSQFHCSNFDYFISLLAGQSATYLYEKSK